MQPSLSIKRSGDLIKSDGGLFNEADWYDLRNTYSPLNETVNNGAVEITYRVTGLATSATYYFGLTIPAGRQFILWRRDLTLTEGKYHVDVISASGGFTGGTTAYKVTLNSAATPTVQTNLMAGVTPQGTETVLSVDLVDAGTNQGAARSNGAATGADNVFKMFQGSNAMLRVTHVGGTAAWDAAVRLIAWEQAV